jgi:hypothetical protein
LTNPKRADYTIEQSPEKSWPGAIELAPKDIIRDELVTKQRKAKRNCAVDKIVPFGEVGRDAIDQHRTMSV